MKNNGFLRKLTLLFLCLTLAFPGAVMAETGGRIEGAGYDTPEDALTAYIQGLVEGDVDKMLSACAVETYVSHYDLEKQIARINALQPPMMTTTYLPDTGSFEKDPFTDSLNMEARRANLIQMIRCQYMTIHYPDLVASTMSSSTVPATEFDSIPEMISTLFPTSDITITFDGVIIPPLLLYHSYYVEINQYQMARIAYADNADQLCSVAALIQVNGTPCILTMGAERYGGKWYMTNANMLATFMGLPSTSGGLAWTTGDEEGLKTLLSDMIDQYFSNDKTKEILQKINNAIASISIQPIFMEHPENDDSRNAYVEAYEAALIDCITEEDSAYMDELLGF